MKSILIILGVIVVGGVIWFAIQTKPDASIPQATVSDISTTTPDESKIVADESINKPVISGKEVDNANVKITFKGFGPGKVHEGSFTKVNSNLKFDASNNLTGQISVDMNSLTTEISKVTSDLKSTTFFDAAKYPTATFTVVSLKDGKVSGMMNIHGVSKNVSFDVKSSESGFTSNFTIDMKEFGIDQKLANEVVELAVSVALK